MTMPDDELLTPLIRREATRHAPPPGLAERIAAQARGAATPASAPWPSQSNRTWPARWRWLLAVLSFGTGAIAASVLMSSVTLRGGTADAIGDELTASHVRSLMAAHLTDVSSTDRHTVKPWFAGKLDYSPPVHDLAEQGYALIGGRLDVVNARPVAALVYRDGPHYINLFVWPAPDHAPSAPTRQGYSLAGWSQQGMQFWAVSDASPAELQNFAQALRTRITSTTATPAR